MYALTKKSSPEKPPVIKELLTLRDLRDIFGIPPSSAYVMFNDGRLPRVKVGYRTYVRRVDVDALISRGLSGVGKAEPEVRT
jgi:hypothetical protein